MSYAVTVSCETSPIWTAYGDTLSPQKSLSGDVNFYDDDFFDEQISFQRYLRCQDFFIEDDVRVLIVHLQ
jgi:hypothetical protein